MIKHVRLMNVVENLKTLSPEIKRYLIIGVSVYVFEVGVIMLTQRLGGSALIAVSLSFWLGLIISFFCKR